jgi:hypothetical protein
LERANTLLVIFYLLTIFSLFTALKDWPDDTQHIDLYHNSNVFTRTQGTGVKGLFTAVPSSTLSLKSGDHISLHLTSGQIWDSGHTNFNGILFQEEF